MEVFEVNKSLQHGIQGIGHIILHSTNAFWQVRTHTWKNSSIFWMLKMSNFTKSNIFIMCLNESMDELFVRTHTSKLFQWFLWIMQNILNTYDNTIRSKLKYFCHIESHCKFRKSRKIWNCNDFEWLSLWHKPVLQVWSNGIIVSNQNVLHHLKNPLK